MSVIDLNSDLGEGIGNDAAIIPCITSANVACGVYAGSPSIMRETVQACGEHGVAIGAHPGLPDREGFGRRVMTLSPDEAHDLVVYQVGALQAFCTAEGLALHHVKPHGALYNQAARDAELARAIALAIQEVDEGLMLCALSGSEMLRAAHDVGLPCASEVFADRAYRADGTLVPRSEPGALIGDPAAAAARVVRMIRTGTVEASDGSELDIVADSVCVHGDDAHALALTHAIHTALEEAGITVRSF